MSDEIHYSVIQRITASDRPWEFPTGSQLYIQVKPHSVHFMAFDYRQMRVLALESIQWTKKMDIRDQVTQLQHFMQGSDWLHPNPFGTVYLSHSSETFTTIPDTLFTSGAEKQWLDLVARVDETKTEIHCNHHTNRDFHLAYVLPVEWNIWATEQFGNGHCQWLSEISGLLEAGISLGREGRFVLALVDVDSVLLTGFDSSKLLFINRFNYSSENDLLYFFLLAIENCGMNPVEDAVLLAGSILGGSAGFEKLARYIYHLEWVKAPPKIHLPENLSVLDHHSWFDLLSLPLSINQLA